MVCCQRRAVGQTDSADDARGCSDFPSLRSVPPAAAGATPLVQRSYRSAVVGVRWIWVQTVVVRILWCFSG